MKTNLVAGKPFVKGLSGQLGQNIEKDVSFK